MRDTFYSTDISLSLDLERLFIHYNVLNGHMLLLEYLGISADYLHDDKVLLTHFEGNLMEDHPKYLYFLIFYAFR